MYVTTLCSREIILMFLALAKLIMDFFPHISKIFQTLYDDSVCFSTLVHKRSANLTIFKVMNVQARITLKLSSTSHQVFV